MSVTWEDNIIIWEPGMCGWWPTPSGWIAFMAGKEAIPIGGATPRLMIVSEEIAMGMSSQGVNGKDTDPPSLKVDPNWKSGRVFPIRGGAYRWFGTGARRALAQRRQGIR
ncbi:MAG: hypothetical protein ABSE48_17345 [Verrucomicrobiota bacterium]